MMNNYFKLTFHLIVLLCVSSIHAGSYEDFFLAVERNDGDTVRSLLQRGFDPNSRSPAGQTAIHLSLRDQSPRVTEALWASSSLDVNAENASGETPLMMAALRGDLTWATRLIERGAKVHREGWAPLHYAATGPEPKIVGLLLDRGAPIDAPSPNRSTPLMMAARYGSESSVKLLLEEGADPTLKNEQGLTALDFAGLGNRKESAVLIQAFVRAWVARNGVR